MAQTQGSVRQELASLFGSAMASAFPGVEVTPYVAQTNDAKFGDYQCNNAMALFGKLKGKVQRGWEEDGAECGWERCRMNHRACLISRTTAPFPKNTPPPPHPHPWLRRAPPRTRAWWPRRS